MRLPAEMAEAMLAVLPDHLQPGQPLGIDLSRGVRVVCEGLVFAWRDFDSRMERARETLRRDGFSSLATDIGPSQHGLYWTHDARVVVSLAIGNLHYWCTDDGPDDWELYTFACDCPIEHDVCCHPAPKDPLLQSDYSASIWERVDGCVVGLVEGRGFCGERAGERA